MHAMLQPALLIFATSGPPPGFHEDGMEPLTMPPDSHEFVAATEAPAIPTRDCTSSMKPLPATFVIRTKGPWRWRQEYDVIVADGNKSVIEAGVYAQMFSIPTRFIMWYGNAEVAAMRFSPRGIGLPVVSINDCNGNLLANLKEQVDDDGMVGSVEGSSVQYEVFEADGVRLAHSRRIGLGDLELTDDGGDDLVTMRFDVVTDSWTVIIHSTVEPRLLDPRLLVLLAISHEGVGPLGLGVLSYCVIFGPFFALALLLRFKVVRVFLLCRGRSGYRELVNERYKKKREKNKKKAKRKVAPTHPGHATRYNVLTGEPY